MAIATASAASLVIGVTVEAASSAVYLTVTPSTVQRGHLVLIRGSAGS